MKTLLSIGLLALCVGCVNTSYEKSITVTKDKDGKVVSTVETETIIQPGQSGWPVKMEYLQSTKGLGAQVVFPK